MASSKDDGKGLPKGVRGPGGPPSAAKPTQPERPRIGAPSASPSNARRSFEEFSRPIIERIYAVPRWIVVIAPAVLLFLGLILSGPLAWLGALMLLIVTILLAWLTALSWPAITPGSRILRVIVVIAIAGVTVLKFLGRF